MNWSLVPGLCILLLFVFDVESTRKEDYCQLNCGEDRHIGCNSTWKLAADCKSVTKIKFGRPQRGLIMTMHNEERDKIAGGWKKLRPAYRMAVMRWNEELARLAELNLNKCYMELDKCRRTVQFRYSGQNIGQLGFKQAMKLDDKIKTVIEYWIKERDSVTPQILRKFKESSKGEPIVGHHTIIIAEKNTDLGCAAIQFPAANIKNFIMTCNYATTNIVGLPIYKTGKRGGVGCEKGRSKIYSHLCTVHEHYDNANETRANKRS